MCNLITITRDELLALLWMARDRNTVNVFNESIFIPNRERGNKITGLKKKKNPSK